MERERAREVECERERGEKERGSRDGEATKKTWTGKTGDGSWEAFPGAAAFCYFRYVDGIKNTHGESYFSSSSSSAFSRKKKHSKP